MSVSDKIIKFSNERKKGEWEKVNGTISQKKVYS